MKTLSSFIYLFLLSIFFIQKTCARGGKSLLNNYSLEDNLGQTSLLVGYYEKMLEMGFIKVKNLQKIIDSSVLINPINKERALESNEAFIHFYNHEELLKNQRESFDVLELKVWAQAKLNELISNKQTRNDVEQETNDVYKSLHFIPLPAGTYKSLIDQTNFIIPLGIEIQDTPVTQYQWFSVMGTTPSFYSEFEDAENVNPEGVAVSLRPNVPIESLSHHELTEFLARLNGQGDGYTYSLPSLDELEAVLCCIHGPEWLIKINNEAASFSMKTEDIMSCPYYVLDGKRIRGITKTIWQLTRDSYTNEHGRMNLVFGMSFFEGALQKFSDIVRPISFTYTTGKTVGIRLVRSKSALYDSREYGEAHFSWAQESVVEDDMWKWHDTSLLFCGDELYAMIDHPERQPRLIRNFIEWAGIADINRSNRELMQFVQNITKKREFDSYFYIDSIRVTMDFSPLKHFKKIESLNVLGNDIVNLHSLKSQPSITTLLMSGCNLISLEDIKPLTNLITLYLNNNKLIDVGGLQSLTQLRELILGRNLIRDVSPLARLSNLRAVNLNENLLEDISPLAGLTEITFLALDDNMVFDLTPLHALKKLTWLRLNRNNIVSVRSLANCTALTRLDASYNRINDVSGLSSLDDLQDLDLNNNNVSDLTPLSSLLSLEKIALRNNPLISLEPLRGLKYLKFVSLTSEQERYLNFSSVLPRAVIY